MTDQQEAAAAAGAGQGLQKWGSCARHQGRAHLSCVPWCLRPAGDLLVTFSASVVRTKIGLGHGFLGTDLLDQGLIKWRVKSRGHVAKEQSLLQRRTHTHQVNHFSLKLSAWIFRTFPGTEPWLAVVNCALTKNWLHAGLGLVTSPFWACVFTCRRRVLNKITLWSSLVGEESILIVKKKFQTKF